MKKTIGILAHVDAGKTTFSEELLHCAGVLKHPGKVDQGTTLMDNDRIEQQRGITIYADQGFFQYGGNDYYLIDTPGHGDFSPEAERAMLAMDGAVLLVDGTKELPAHLITLFRMLEKRKIPVFFFINKMDLEGADAQEIITQIQDRLTPDVILLDDAGLDMEGSLGEFLAQRDEDMLEAYLDQGIDQDQGIQVLQKLVRTRQAFPAMAGSALRQQDVADFLALLDQLSVTFYDPEGSLKALVYRIKRNEKGQRITFLKVLQGSLEPREEFSFVSEEGEKVSEKVSQVLECQGARYYPCLKVCAGDLAAVTGLTIPRCGDLLTLEGRQPMEGEFLMKPSMQARIQAQDGTDDHHLLQALKILEDEEPQLQIRVSQLPEGGEQICAGAMGKIQMEVLVQKLWDRFQIQAVSLQPQVLYQETIKAPVMGYGHYEPLRHYAEVNLLLEPGARGSGITFESRCHVDVLDINYQRLIRHWALCWEHKGVLTGSALTDVHIVLINGRSHLKHTEGGDFWEATRRAVRQGLEKAENVLLEPWYSFEITAPSDCMGRILSDITKNGGQAQPPEIKGDWVCIQGQGPAENLMDYPQTLAALSRGKAGISFVNCGYRPCADQEAVVAAMGYNRGADKDNPSSSVFCSHGAGFTVNWDQAESYMHCLKS